MNKASITKIILEISRILIAITFLFSGFVKAIDPRGFAYKIEDYFTAFGVSALDSLALPLAVGLCILEFVVGAFILFGLYRKWTTRILLLIMLFMTPLTLYLAIKNPVSDCGCFGDAWIIGNWETFFKNVILIACALFLYLNPERITNLFTGKTYWLASFFIVIYIFIFSIFNITFEPIIDFRPYKLGANLKELTSVPEGAGDVYENVMIYEKNGEKKEFTEDNYPWQDTTWHFVDRNNKLIKEGVKPQVTDFTITHLLKNSDGSEFTEEEDITNDILENDSYTFLMIAYSLLDMDDTHLSKFEDVYNYAQERGYNFYVLTSSLKDDILRWERDNAVDFDFALTDERTLKTIVRANPGMLILKDGQIIEKWADFQVPEEATLTDSADVLFKTSTISPRSVYLNSSIFFFTPLLLLIGVDSLAYRKKRKDNKKEETK